MEAFAASMRLTASASAAFACFLTALSTAACTRSLYYLSSVISNTVDTIAGRGGAALLLPCA